MTRPRSARAPIRGQNLPGVAPLAAALLLGGAAATAAGHRQSPKPDGYATYANARFGYSVAYPAKRLAPKGESDNGDGQRFASADGKGVLIVYGRHDVGGRVGADATTLAAAVRAEQRAGNAVTYRAQGKGWFVVSGTDDGAIFYRKTLARDGVLVTASLEYPKSRRATFDPVVKRVAASLRWTAAPARPR